MARVGILGGTFNPPHLGHLALARHARVELALAGVYLIPAHASPHKPSAPDPGAEHRVHMCRLLAQDAEDVSVCTLEVGRGGTSYTVDTLHEIRAAHPHAELVLIAGADSALGMPAWREPRALFELADIAVAARAGTDHGAVQDALAPLLGTAKLSFLSAPVLDVSSSQARERAARGEPLEDLVGEPVTEYITTRGLYRAGARTR
jgi:nicotinate-nucleotide adenylyltransferase